MGKQITDSTQPILDEKKKKSIFEEIFGEFYSDVENQNIVKKDIDPVKEKSKPAKIIKNKIIEDKQNSFEIKEEDEFDLRKAVIYSTILNNPFIDKSI
ncbi:MAG: hypothetical protein PHD45_02640 [Bacteroidales bacterium]|nr:hypothetical protein [Bacteroidales bacterium]